MPSSAKKRTGRRVNIVQFLALLVSVAVIGSLMGLLGAGLMLPVVGAAGATVRAVPETFEEMPAELEVIQPSEGSKMLDAEGHMLAQFFTERRTIVTSDQISPIMKNAIVAIEDWRFYNHHGIDPEGMLRALFNNVVVRGNTQGASTITQQYVKNILVNQGIQSGDQDQIDEAQEQSVQRKLREARYAVALEAQMPKDEILTGYLNISMFGTNIYGVEAASRAYFSKSASELTIPEAALLAGAVKSPSDYDPTINPEASQERRDLVLDEMAHRGYITEAERDEAKAIPVEEMLNPEVLVSGCSGAGTAAYFCEYVLADLLNDDALGPDRASRERKLNTGGLTIRTTLQRDRQSAAYQAAIDRVPVDDESGLDTAIVSLVPETGHIVAMAQNTRFGIATESDPRATTLSYTVGESHGGGTGFAPGSTFKMFSLVEWFYEGHSAYESVGSAKRNYKASDFRCGASPLQGEAWTVGDLPGKDGAFNVIQATALSVNQAFAYMGTKMDLCKVFERAEQMGVTNGATGERIQTVAPNIIGSDSVTPLSMATAYGTLANDGVRCTPMAVTEIEGADGSIVKTNSPNCSPAIDATVAQQVSTVLERSASTYTDQIGRPMAAKSGTTNQSENTWMVGFVPQLATAAWAGFANASSTPVSNIWINGQFYETIYGGTFIGPMWAQYMTQALAETPVEPIPEVFIGNHPVVTPTTPTTPGTTPTTPDPNATTPNTEAGGD